MTLACQCYGLWVMYDDVASGEDEVVVHGTTFLKVASASLRVASASSSSIQASHPLRWSKKWTRSRGRHGCRGSRHCAPLCAGLDRGIGTWLPWRRNPLLPSTRGRDCAPLVDAGMMHPDGVESWNVARQTYICRHVCICICTCVSPADPRSSKDGPRWCHSSP